jgi:hypothetical protein
MTSEVPWGHVHEALEQARNYWVVTTRRSGAPHARPVWGLWWQNTFLFTVDPTTGTARNLGANPKIGVHLESAESVVILDGVAEQPAEPTAIAGTLMDAWARKYPHAPRETRDIKDLAAYLVRPTVVRAWTLERYPNDITRWRAPLPA